MTMNPKNILSLYYLPGNVLTCIVNLVLRLLAQLTFLEENYTVVIISKRYACFTLLFSFFLQLCRSFINYFQHPLAICHEPPGVPGLHFDNRSDKISDDNGKYAEIMLYSDN